MKVFERIHLSSHLIVMLAVVCSGVVAIGTVCMASIDAVALLQRFAAYADLSLSDPVRNELNTELLTGIVRVVDGYLLGAFMLIFAMGVYELFVSKVEVAEGSDLASRVSLIRTLDDLKDRLAKVVILILLVKFLQQALGPKYVNALDLLFLALGTLLIGAAVYLTGVQSGASAKPD